MAMTPEQKELIRESEELEKDLKGGVADAVPRSIAFLIRQQRVHICSNYVHDAVCLTRMAACPAKKPRFGWPAYAAFATALVAVVGMIIHFT